MITPDGWLSFATREPGPATKVYSEPNTAQGYVPHSMVGRLVGWYSRLFDLSRLPDGSFTPNAAASVHGSILLDGHVIQHYPFTASCWASGGRHQNTNFVAFENESLYANGRPDETLDFTPAQVASNLLIIRDLAAWKGWMPRRPQNLSDKTATLYEHTEAVTIFGGRGTSCPSARTAPLWAQIGAAMPELEEQKLRARIAAANILMDYAQLILAGQPLPEALRAQVRFLAS